MSSPNKKIAVIGHPLHTGGGYTSGLSLLKAFAQMDTPHSFLFILPANVGYEKIELPSNIEICFYAGGSSFKHRFIFDHRKLPKIIKDYSPDIILGLASFGLPTNIPQFVLVRQAYTVYRFKELPWLSLDSKIKVCYYKWMLKRSIKSCTHIFVQTPVMQNRLADYYSYPVKDISIIPFAVPDNISRQHVEETHKSANNSLRILVLTRFLPHRNPNILIPLLSKYKHQLKQVVFVTTLDPEEKHSKAFLDSVRQHHFNKYVDNIGILPLDKVRVEMARADVMLFPTCLETLGIPYLEAMYSNLPIITPDLDFARYVCGKAALYYDRNSIDSLYAKIMLFRNDNSERHKLKYNCKLELKKFSSNWEESSNFILDKMLDILR